MKLNLVQIDAVEKRTGVQPIPESHPVATELVSIFGEQTFYIDHDGILTWEVVELKDDGSMQLGGMRLASWADDGKTELAPHVPSEIGNVIEIGPFEPKPAD